MAANTITLDSLTEYVNEHRDELLTKAIAGAKTLDYIELMAGVKHKDALNYLDSTVVLADGSVCGWNPAGDDTFTQRVIEVFPVSVQKEFCARDFKNYYMNHQLNFAAGRETLPFEQKIAESNMDAIKKAVENLIWNGDEDLGIDGFLAQIADDGTISPVEFAEGTTTIAKVDAMVAALPVEALAKGVNIFMSYTDFRAYVAEQNASCCANRPIIDAAAEDLKYVGDSRITLVPVAGLEGTDSMVAASADALVYGTDIEDSENIYEMFFDKKEGKFLFNVLFNAGTAIKWVDEVVLGAPASEEEEGEDEDVED